MNSEQSRQRAGEIVLLCTSRAYDVRRMSAKMIGPRHYDLVWHENPNVPWCSFHPPSDVLINVHRALNLPDAQITKAVLDAMVSWHMYQVFCLEREAWRDARVPSKVPKPVWHSYGSGRWSFVKNKFLQQAPPDWGLDQTAVQG